MFSALAMPSDQEIENLALNRYFEEAKEIGLSVCDSLSKANYASLAIDQMLAPEILLMIQSAFGVDMYVSQPAAMPMICNMITGGLQIVSGVFQMKMAFQNEVYNPVGTGVSGMLSIGSGGQLIALTAIAPLTLGPIALAVSSGIASGFLWNNFFHAIRKVKDEDFWLEDSIAQLAFLRKGLSAEQSAREKRMQIRKDLDEANADQAQAALLNNETLNIVTDFVFYLAANRIENNIKQAEKLEREIIARLLVDYKEKGPDSYLMRNMFLEKNFDMFSPKGKACLNGIRKTYNPDVHRANYKIARELHVNRKYAEAFDTNPNAPFSQFVRIARKSKKAAWYNDARPKLWDALMMTMAFVGFLLLAIPGTQIFSIPFLSSSSFYFVFGKLLPAGKSVWHSIHTFCEHRQEGINQAERYASFAHLNLFPKPSAKPKSDVIDGTASSLEVEKKKKQYCS